MSRAVPAAQAGRHRDAVALALINQSHQKLEILGLERVHRVRHFVVLGLGRDQLGEIRQHEIIFW